MPPEQVERRLDEVVLRLRLVRVRTELPRALAVELPEGRKGRFQPVRLLPLRHPRQVVAQEVVGEEPAVHEAVGEGELQLAHGSEGRVWDRQDRLRCARSGT